MNLRLKISCGIFLAVMVSFLLNSVAFVSSAVASNSLNSTNETDSQTLLAIKDQIQRDPYEFLASWNNSIHFCSWKGVECNITNQRVTALNLPGLELRGFLSPYIGNLTFLKELNLGNNSFYGTIPDEIGRLYHLQHISLSNNSFQGEIPRNLSYCSDVRVVKLERNNLEGTIPAELSSLPNLLELHLSLNLLNGSIPPSLGNLSALRALSLSDNNLGGSIPTAFGKLSNLEILKLSSNRFSGEPPALLFNISSIRHIVLASNFLNGPFPWDFGLQLPKLQTFYVGENQFSGPIPSSIVNASELVILDISMNALFGPIPMNLGNLKQLQRLDFSGNPLGSNESVGLNFLTSLTNCTNLRILHLNGNNLKGVLPSLIANLSTKLTSLRLDSNYISGGIPEGLENLINLENLALSQNMLTGTIPEFVGRLTKLQGLYLSRNNFSGVIPSSIGNITLLSILEMQENTLGGSIPVSLSSCRRLLALNLSHNRLTGAIPEDIFGLSSLTLGLSLANNLLIGPLPFKADILINLLSLDVSNNRLSREVPQILGSCVALELLDLHGNLFRGSIPVSLQALQSIQFLDLSSNNISGLIPADLTRLIFIQYLNLSFNLLKGEVPNVGLFTNSTAFSIIGNEKLCGGMKSLGLPACPKQTRKRKVSLSILLIILSSGSPVFVLLVCISVSRYRTRKTRSLRKEVSSDLVLGDHYANLSYTELIQATDGFSQTNLISMGRYSSVYKGILKHSEQKVAVKLINLQHRGARKSFVAECEALRYIRHRNLVKIITSCSGTDLKGNEFKALVYELMPNGDLESWLHPIPPNSQQPKNLDLIQRLNIAVDVASALYYLHHCCEIPVIHRDIKPSNILLDDDLCAHLGDFGSARSLLIPIDRSTHLRIRSSAIGIVGTLGYVALECGMGGRVSTLVDVYSYGILLLEMFSGKRPTDGMFRDNFCLHNYVKMAIPDQVLMIADPRLLLEEEIELRRRASQTRRYTSHKVENCLASIFRIGVTCSARLPGERMEIADALMELKTIRDVFLRVDEKAILSQ